MGYERSLGLNRDQNVAYTTTFKVHVELFYISSSWSSLDHLSKVFASGYLT